MRTWPLTGRAEELAFIDAASTSPNGSRGVVLAGAAGVGKTRLAREALASAARRGMTTRWVAATESARKVPLGAVAPLLSTVVEDPTLVLRNAQADLLAGGESPIVGIDDAHLLDDLSSLLVQQLVLRRAATVVLTVRTGEPAPDAVTALWKDEHLDRLELQPLSEAETATLLEAVLAGPVESVSVQRMWTLTAGNVLFLRHLVDGELQADRLRTVAGVWRGTGEPVLSPGLTDVIVDRMGRISEPARVLVDLLALGEPIDVTLLGQMCGESTVEECESLGLLTVAGGGGRLQARLAHPLYGEVRREQLGTLRARRLRGRIAVALADAPESDPGESLRRAVLMLDSDLEPDVPLLGTAALSASRLVDLTLAERLAKAAVAAGGGFAPHLTLANSLSFQSRADEADAELAALEDVASNEVERSIVGFTRAGNLLWPGRRPLDAEAVLDRVDTEIADDGCRRVLGAMRAATDYCQGRASAAMPRAVDALADPDLPAPAVMIAIFALTAALGVLGRVGEIATIAARGYAEANRSPDVAFLRFGLAHVHVGALRLAGLIREAAAVALDRYRESRDMPGPAQLYGVHVFGQAALAHGQVRTAVRSLREVRGGLMPMEDEGGPFGFGCMLHLTEALAMAGDTEAAREVCDQLEADRHPAFAYLEPEVQLARAWVAASEGTVGRAIEICHQAADEAVRLGQPAHQVAALHAAVRLGDRTVAGELDQLATIVDGPRAPAAATHAAALASNNGEGLKAVSVRLEEMGDVVAAADAAAQAADALRGQGRASSATAAAARAQRLTDSCEGVRTPALIAVARPLPLTPREREIVTLAAQGLSSRKIAKRLVVSVRTVEGHLYNASAKLGTTSRAEFAAMLAGD